MKKLLALALCALTLVFACAAAMADAKPRDTHASVRRLILPTIFSWYSPMSFWTGIRSAIRDAPYAGSQDVSSCPK